MANNATLTGFKVRCDFGIKHVYVDLFFGKKNMTVYSTDARQYTNLENREEIVKELNQVWAARLRRTKASLEKYLD